MRVPAAAILLLFAAVSRQASPPAVVQPPRDGVRRAELAGTAAIRGRVVASDTGSPIRRAAVSLTATGPAPAASVAGLASRQPPALEPRRTTTDAQGAFEFAGLPAGTYRVTAFPEQHSAQYVGMAAYGANGPGAPSMPSLGRAIQLTDGQSFDRAVIVLPRAAAITGRVTDENAEPLVGVQVDALFFPTGSTGALRTAGARTDDLGQFRVFGLYAGEYAVVAQVRDPTDPNGLPETEDSRVGLLTTYYPGTPDEGSAGRVRARPGVETPGIDIRLARGRTFHLSGTITDSRGRPIPMAFGQLVRRALGVAGQPIYFSGERGQFQVRNVPAGRYRLVIELTSPIQDGSSPAGVRERASVPVTIAGDVDGLTVTTGPSATITGRIVFEQGPPSPLPEMRVNAASANPEETGPWPLPVATVKDFAFTMEGLTGESLLRAAVPNHYVKSVAVNGDDITDRPHEFKTDDRVVITLTSRAGTIEGRVIDETGAVCADAGVAMFSEDRAFWRTTSTRSRRASVDVEGRFRITGLMPGRYFIGAVSRARLSMPSSGTDTAFFEELSKQATAIVIGEGEQRTVDLKLIGDQ